MATIRRGDVWLARLDPTSGREIAKTRPVLVVSNDLNNRFSGTVTALPLTSRNTDEPYPFEVTLLQGKANLPKDSKVKADQIRTLDVSRLVCLIGAVAPEDMLRVETAMRVHLGLE